MPEQKSGRRIAIVVGTVAEFLKLIPLIREFDEKHVDHVLVFTGQNNLERTLTEFNIHPEIVRLDTFLGISTNPIRAMLQTPRLISALGDTFRGLGTRCVLYHGDTLSTFAAALAGRRQGSMTAHIEAGLRSHSMGEPFPEEIFRIAADRNSDLLFTPSVLASLNLEREKIKGQVQHTGNTVADLVKTVSERAGGQTENAGFVLATAHRVENIYNYSRLKRVMKILSLPRLPVYWVVHHITEVQIRRFGFQRALLDMDLHLLPQLSYFEFMKLLMRCNYIMTDGGGIQEESIILRKPCLLLRNRTERVEGLRTGLNFLTRLDFDWTRNVIRQLEDGRLAGAGFENPYAIEGTSPSRLITQGLVRALR